MLLYRYRCCYYRRDLVRTKLCYVHFVNRWTKCNIT